MENKFNQESEDKQYKSEDILNIYKQLESVLIEGEVLEAVSIQHRLFTLLPIPHRRKLIAATNGRFILMKRKLIRGYNIIDYRWQDISEVYLKVGIFGTDLQIVFFDGEDLSLNKNYLKVIKLIGFEKEGAQLIYRIAQAQDQSWREKRRIRSIEELRARSGGINVGSKLGENHNYTDNGEKNLERLKHAKKMRDENLISDTEYETLKAKIISEI